MVVLMLPDDLGNEGVSLNSQHGPIGVSVLLRNSPKIEVDTLNNPIGFAIEIFRSFPVDHRASL
jgi:hypothetical protein